MPSKILNHVYTAALPTKDFNKLQRSLPENTQIDLTSFAKVSCAPLGGRQPWELVPNNPTAGYYAPQLVGGLVWLTHPTLGKRYAMDPFEYLEATIGGTPISTRPLIWRVLAGSTSGVLQVYNVLAHDIVPTTPVEHIEGRLINSGEYRWIQKIHYASARATVCAIRPDHSVYMERITLPVLSTLDLLPQSVPEFTRQKAVEKEALHKQKEHLWHYDSTINIVEGKVQFNANNPLEELQENIAQSLAAAEQLNALLDKEEVLFKNVKAFTQNRRNENWMPLHGSTETSSNILGEMFIPSTMLPALKDSQPILTGRNGYPEYHSQACHQNLGLMWAPFAFTAYGVFRTQAGTLFYGGAKFTGTFTEDGRLHAQFGVVITASSLELTEADYPPDVKDPATHGDQTIAVESATLLNAEQIGNWIVDMLGKYSLGIVIAIRFTHYRAKDRQLHIGYGIDYATRELLRKLSKEPQTPVPTTGNLTLTQAVARYLPRHPFTAVF